jgi:hypothetical protein
MNIYRVLKIVFFPAKGSAIFLGTVVIMALIQFVLINPQVLLKVTAYTFGYVFWALSLKLILGVIFGVFVEITEEHSPRGMMLLFALVLIASGMILLAPLLLEHSDSGDGLLNVLN